MKKIVPFILAFTLLLSTFTVPASAAVTDISTASAALYSYFTSTGVPLQVIGGSGVSSAETVFTNFAAATGSTVDDVVTAVAAGTKLNPKSIIISATATVILSRVFDWVLDSFSDNIPSAPTTFSTNGGTMTAPLGRVAGGTGSTTIYNTPVAYVPLSPWYSLENWGYGYIGNAFGDTFRIAISKLRVDNTYYEPSFQLINLVTGSNPYYQIYNAVQSFNGTNVYRYPVKSNFVVKSWCFAVDSSNHWGVVYRYLDTNTNSYVTNFVYPDKNADGKYVKELPPYDFLSLQSLRISSSSASPSSYYRYNNTDYIPIEIPATKALQITLPDTAELDLTNVGSWIDTSFSADPTVNPANSPNSLVDAQTDPDDDPVPGPGLGNSDWDPPKDVGDNTTSPDDPSTGFILPAGFFQGPWHYVVETIRNSTAFVAALISALASLLPGSLWSLIWCAVVLALVFSLIRRLIE